MDTATSPLAALVDGQLLKTDALIDGQWVAGSVRFPVVDPATGRPLCDVANLGRAETDAAIAAAENAWPAWRSKSAKERAAILMKWFALLHQHADDLARIMTAEQGKPLAEAKGEVVYGASFIEWFAEEAKRVYGETIPSTDNNKRYLVIKQPTGVCAAITPWNFPIAMITRKVAPALAAGCTVVLKPSEVTPLNAFILAEVVEAAGLPAGVFNLVSGTGPVVGEAIAGHPGVDMVSFTGSTRAGRRVSELASPTVKPVAMELGGKSPNVILDDADLARAVPDGVAKCFLNSGQTCSALTRMLVPREKLGEAEQIAKQAAEAFTPGDPFEDSTRIGPLVSETQRERVRGYIEKGEAEGAKLVTGGAAPPEGLERGYFVRPTVFSEVTPEMTIAQEEIFGPVLAIQPYDGEDDAVRIANDTVYGLAGGVWSGDQDRAISVAKRIRTGQIEINGGAFNPLAPFGGYKQSGHGRENGRYAIEELLQVKSLQL